VPKIQSRKLFLADTRLLQRLTTALDLTIISLVISARSMELQRLQHLAERPPEMKVAVPQAEDLAPVQSSKNPKCCVRCSIHFLKMTCFPWALPAVVLAVGPVLVLQDCPFSKVLFSLRRCPWRWKPLLKTKCSRPAQCRRSPSLGERSMKNIMHFLKVNFAGKTSPAA
jgi:hypothetical protein